MDRRAFVFRTAAALVAVSAPMLRAGQVLGSAMPEAFPEQGVGLSAAQWRTLAAVQDHLFPSEPDAPGARDVNAANYLHTVLSRPDYDPVDREFILTGVDRLDGVARKQADGPFVDLAVEDQEKVLRTLEKMPDGSQWITMVLDFILEALLTDPVYGGNPRGIGWRWLEHQPGFPRPTPEKRYFLL